MARRWWFLLAGVLTLDPGLLTEAAGCLALMRDGAAPRVRRRVTVTRGAAFNGRVRAALSATRSAALESTCGSPPCEPRDAFHAVYMTYDYSRLR